MRRSGKQSATIRPHVATAATATIQLETAAVRDSAWRCGRRIALAMALTMEAVTIAKNAAQTAPSSHHTAWMEESRQTRKMTAGPTAIERATLSVTRLRTEPLRNPQVSLIQPVT